VSIAGFKTTVQQTGNGPTMGPQLTGVKRYPHCSISNPNFVLVWASQGRTVRADGGNTENWGCYACLSCGSIVTVRGTFLPALGQFHFTGLFPSEKIAHEDIPEPARTFLQQAFETLHAPDAAAVMAGSAVDAMLKQHGLTEGSLYSRIDQALTKNLLTQGMADWAHEVRLGSNRPRHADKDKPHVSPDEAKQSVEFAEALGYFLFVLAARIDRGIKAASMAEVLK
jgi:uncharacterized protein DUF4145